MRFISFCCKLQCIINNYILYTKREHGIEGRFISLLRIFLSNNKKSFESNIVYILIYLQLAHPLFTQHLSRFLSRWDAVLLIIFSGVAHEIKIYLFPLEKLWFSNNWTNKSTKNNSLIYQVSVNTFCKCNKRFMFSNELTFSVNKSTNHSKTEKLNNSKQCVC